MIERELDLTVYEKAIKSLEEIVKIYETNREENMCDIFRDSLIQRFEYTFELSHKILRRYIAWHIPMPDNEVAELSFSEIIRIANEKGLLQQPKYRWELFRKMRNLTSHTYDEKLADDVISVIPQFLEEVQRLLFKMKENLQ